MRQWDDAMAQMQRNDAAIAAATQLFADKKAHLRSQQIRLDARAKQLDEQLVANKERDAQIDVLDRQLDGARGEHTGEKVRSLRGLCCAREVAGCGECVPPGHHALGLRH